MWHLYLMAAFYCYAGISHFRNPRFFLAITPPWVPQPEKVNILVGVIEIVLALGLIIPMTRSLSAIGIIALLVVVFPANIFHHQKVIRKGKNSIPTLIRLPIQLLLILWAYQYI